MAYNSFEQVNSLNEMERKALLQQGDPSERVWSAWSLGLELGASLNHDLIQSLNQEPHPGTRRHLVIILAGHGEKALVTTIAKHDPDELVRATACQYLIQTAATKDADLENFLIEILMSDESPYVHKVILDNASNGFPKLSANELAPRTKSKDVEVRRLAVDLIMAQVTGKEFVSLLGGHIFEETDDDLRIYLEGAFIKAGETNSLLKMAIEASETLRLEITSGLIQSGIKFAWDEIVPLSDLRDPCTDWRLAQLVDRRESSKAFHWLIENISRMEKWPSPRNRAESNRYHCATACARLSEELLLKALPDITLEQITDRELKMVDMIISHLEEYQSLIEQWDDLSDEYTVVAMADRLQLIDELKLLKKRKTRN